jgi:hypothetical protein
MQEQTSENRGKDGCENLDPIPNTTVFFSYKCFCVSHTFKDFAYTVKLSKPRDWGESLKAIPPSLLKFFVQAFNNVLCSQSYKTFLLCLKFRSLFRV